LEVGGRVIGTQSSVVRLYLIRHGETEWSLSGRHTSRTDLHLTERGELDARKLGECLRATRFSRVLAILNHCQRPRRRIGNLEEIGANGNSCKHHQGASVLEGVEP